MLGFDRGSQLEDDPRGDEINDPRDESGGAGVREPRRPRPPAPFGAAAVLELPAAEHDNLTAYPEDVDARRLDAG